MFLEAEIKTLGTRLLEKAGLTNNVTFSIEAPFWLGDANAFLASTREIYSIPERNFYEFKTLQPLVREAFGVGADTFLAVQKINIAHEIGHALQPHLLNVSAALYEMKSTKVVETIPSIDALLAHIDTYKQHVLAHEEDAWTRAWELIQDDTDETLFQLIRTHALSTYKSSNFLLEEESFYMRHVVLQQLTNGMSIQDN